MDFNELNKNFMNCNANDFGKSIKNRREEIGLSLRSVAKKLNISATYLSDIEKAKRNFPFKKVSQFIEALDIPDDQIDAFKNLAYIIKIKRNLTEKEWKQIIDLVESMKK